ncbi:ABC transporter permease [Paenibacillus sp. NFR01]|uniref:ABC transporter permease n=1 Tax=Paenibacillus sp. NFR01 TaxID=1566279 RepID=UPI0008B6B6DF|nr:ABC transporter permease [Paenibacillus sp. NFR01]SET18549.1 putative ABC transport system permease protein [Paenibacillus sp. NFR01]
MFLALREMRHSKARYGLIMAIMFLVSFLVLFVTGLARGLAYANISAVEHMPAGYFAVQKDAGHTFRRSQLTDADLAAIAANVSAEKSAPLALQMGTITSAGMSEKADVTFFVADMNSMLAPNLASGEGLNGTVTGNAVVDASLENSGVELGSTITDQATGQSWKVAGFAKDGSYSHTPVVYLNQTDGLSLLQRGAAEPSYNTVALDISASQAKLLAGKLDQAEIITKSEAIAAIPGYAMEQMSLRMMIVFLFVIVALVLAVFFYVITIQKTSQFGILKAMGTPMPYLAWSVVGQVLLLAAVSLAISIGFTLGMSMGIPDAMPFRLERGTVLLSSALFLAMALLGSLISVGRVAKIDALEAIGRSGA